MLIRVTDKQLTIEASDPVIVDLAARPLMRSATRPTSLAPSAVTSRAAPASASRWLALRDSLEDIQRRAAPPPGAPGTPDHPGAEAA